jgi:hypothetical protein
MYAGSGEEGLNMPPKESPISLAERHVAEAERRIGRQRALIAQLERDRHAATAEHGRKILEVLQESLRLARVHLELERAHYGGKQTDR